jgi:hypothetical protein
MDGFQFPPKCDFKLDDGADCPVPASHSWGSVKSCCSHFELFCMGLLDTDRIPAKPRHIDIVEEYNRQCGRDSKIPGTECKAGD